MWLRTKTGELLNSLHVQNIHIGASFDNECPEKKLHYVVLADTADDHSYVLIKTYDRSTAEKAIKDLEEFLNEGRSSAVLDV